MSNLLTGNVTLIQMLQVTIDPASVNANTSVEQTFTVPGLQVGDMVVTNKPTTTVGLTVGGFRVSAANTLAMTLGNLTGSAINPASERYMILVFRHDAPSIASLPSAVMA